jgi:hypothetical protein
MTKEQFLKDVNPWGNHRFLLYEALEATKHLKLPILELGSGPSSTPFLRQWCKDEGVKLDTYETDRNWAVTMDSKWVMSWDAETFWDNHYAVCLLDCAPGMYRKEALLKLTNTEIIILHDSEPRGWNASDYQVRPLFPKFKHVKDQEPKDDGKNIAKGAPWTTALSNTIDVTKFIV